MAIRSIIAWPALDRVVIGTPAAEAIRDEADRIRTERVFLVTVPALSSGTTEIDRIREALGRRYAGMYDSMPAHAPTDHIITASCMAREAGADLLVTIGGSSVTDAGKVMRICLKHGLTAPEQLDPYHYSLDAEGMRVVPDFEGPDIPMIAVPTTLSGAEFSPVAGARNSEKKIKEGYHHRLLTPRTVVLDSAITMHTPKWLWLSTGIKAMDHAFETLGSFLSNDFCDGMADSALKLLKEGLTRVKNNPEDSEAMMKCMIGAWQSMIPLLTGVPMGASHAIGHALGSVCDVPHGYTSCVIAPFILKYNESVNGERQKRISLDLDELHTAASVVVEKLIRDLDMPGSLDEIGVTPDRYEEIAAAAMSDDWIYTNPGPVRGLGDVVEILRMAGR